MIRENPKRIRWYDKVKTCAFCHETFEASRYDARFCGSVCRSANANRVRALKQRTATITKSIEALRRDYGTKFKGVKYNPDYDLVGEMYGELTAIKQKIDKLLDSITF